MDGLLGAKPLELTDVHFEAMMQRLDRAIELLAEQSGILTARRYTLEQMVVSVGTIAAVIFPVVPGGDNLVWLLERYTQSTNSSGAPTFGVYIMDIPPPTVQTAALDDLYLRDWTNLTPKSVGDNRNPIQARGGQVVIGQWQGLAGAGAICKATIQAKLAWQGTD